MTLPPLLSRCLGYSYIITLIGLYAFLLGAWYADQLPFVLGFLVVPAVWKTMKAFDQRREEDDADLLLAAARNEENLHRLPAPSKPYAGVVTRNTVALMYLHASLVWLPYVSDTGGHLIDVMEGLWWLSALYLMWTVGRLAWPLFNRFRKPAAPSLPAPVEPEDDMVAWMLEVPQSAPSREMAERELPDYCARLITRAS